jgi:hypothetical protein
METTIHPALVVLAGQQDQIPREVVAGSVMEGSNILTVDWRTSCGIWN